MRLNHINYDLIFHNILANADLEILPYINQLAITAHSLMLKSQQEVTCVP